MSRLIKQYPPLSSGEPLELYANSINKFELPKRYIIPFGDREWSNLQDIPVYYSFIAKEKEPGMWLKAWTTEYGSPSVKIKLNEEEVAQELYRIIVEKGIRIEESNAIQAIEAELDEQLATVLFEKSQVFFCGTVLEGNGFLLDTDDDCVASFENVHFTKDGVKTSNAFGWLDKDFAKGVFLLRDGRYLEFPQMQLTKKTLDPKNDLYKAIFSVHQCNNIQDHIPEKYQALALPAEEEYEDITAYISSRRKMLASAEEKESENDFEFDLDF